MSAQVRCKIILEKAIGSFEGATVHAYLEDVTLQDGPAKIVGRGRIEHVAHQSEADEELEIVLQGVEPDARAQYAVRVHVALHGEEDIRQGDYLTTQSYPVLTFGHPDHVTVRLREAK